jgi:hypothetical protein
VRGRLGAILSLVDRAQDPREIGGIGGGGGLRRPIRGGVRAAPRLGEVRGKGDAEEGGGGVLVPRCYERGGQGLKRKRSLSWTEVPYTETLLCKTPSDVMVMNAHDALCARRHLPPLGEPSAPRSVAPPH